MWIVMGGRTEGQMKQLPSLLEASVKSCTILIHPFLPDILIKSPLYPPPTYTFCGNSLKIDFITWKIMQQL